MSAHAFGEQHADLEHADHFFAPRIFCCLKLDPRASLFHSFASTFLRDVGLAHMQG
jgi:hypothetical protein